MILADARWNGAHGIARYAHEVLARLKNCETLTDGPSPLSLKNFYWLPNYLRAHPQYQFFYSPGFNPLLFSNIPFAFTIHDLIHLQLQDRFSLLKKIYYQTIMKQAAKKAKIIFTVSEFSKKMILEWSDVSKNKVVVAGCGVSEVFKPEGEKINLGFPYLLHVGSTKPHKNTERLVKAFSLAKINPNIHLIFTGECTKTLRDVIQKNKVENKIIFTNTLSETELASYYRGAEALVFPSLFEGFGLPVIESMACGTPVITSNVTSLPEIAGDAALLIDPSSISSLQSAIETLLNDSSLRHELIQKGFPRAAFFSWDKTSHIIQRSLHL